MMNFLYLLNGTSLASISKTLETCEKFPRKDQGVINVYDVECTTDASLSLLMTALMNHQ